MQFPSFFCALLVALAASTASAHDTTGLTQELIALDTALSRSGAPAGDRPLLAARRIAVTEAIREDLKSSLALDISGPTAAVLGSDGRRAIPLWVVLVPKVVPGKFSDYEWSLLPQTPGLTVQESPHGLVLAWPRVPGEHREVRVVASLHVDPEIQASTTVELSVPPSPPPAVSSANDRLRKTLPGLVGVLIVFALVLFVTRYLDKKAA